MPTPLTSAREPDLSYLIDLAEVIDLRGVTRDIEAGNLERL